MKDSGICPKCESKDIVRISAGTTGLGVGNNIPVGLLSIDPVHVTRFLCADCGFLENWIEKKPAILRVKKQYGKP